MRKPNSRDVRAMSSKGSDVMTRAALIWQQEASAKSKQNKKVFYGGLSNVPTLPAMLDIVIIFPLFRRFMEGRMAWVSLMVPIVLTANTLLIRSSVIWSITPTHDIPAIFTETNAKQEHNN